MHTESAVIRQQALALFSKLNNGVRLDFELRHKAIIDRFGRYSHRNVILGRESTFEEQEFLQQPDSNCQLITALWSKAVNNQVNCSSNIPVILPVAWGVARPFAPVTSLAIFLVALGFSAWMQLELFRVYSIKLFQCTNSSMQID